MPTVKYSEATAAQLRAFAVTRYGLDLSSNTNGPQVKAKLAEVGFDGDTIEVDEELAPKSKPLTVEDVAERKTVLINIPQQEGPGGKDAVCVGVNGVVARIMRGKDVRVPVEYVEVLRNANKIVYDRDENNQLIEPGVEVPIHPFSIVGL